MFRTSIVFVLMTMGCTTEPVPMDVQTENAVQSLCYFYGEWVGVTVHGESGMSVDLSVSGLPAQTSAWFDPNPTVIDELSGSSVLKLSLESTPQVSSSSTITVTAVGANGTRATTTMMLELKTSCL